MFARPDLENVNSTLEVTQLPSRHNFGYNGVIHVFLGIYRLRTARSFIINTNNLGPNMVPCGRCGGSVISASDLGPEGREFEPWHKACNTSTVPSLVTV